MSDPLHPCAVCGQPTFNGDRLCANCFFALGDDHVDEPEEDGQQ